jgi:hypothetical protein
MATLGELYNRVRVQTDTISSELPDNLINNYLHEAFERTIAAENLWPFFEQVWEIPLPVGVSAPILPDAVNETGITAFIDDDHGFRLKLTDFESALDIWGGQSSGAVAHEFSLWTNQIRLWPSTMTHQTDKTYSLYGFRHPVQWSTLSINDTPDCDERLHLPLAHYAIALAYAREEDPGLERNYMERWQKDVEMIRRAIMQPNQMRPIVMGPHRITPIGRGGLSDSYAITINTP